MRWVETPLSGADSTPAAWRAGGELLNGGGWVDHSWGSHKTYNYSWRNSSARQAAQLMKSYRDGAFGRGLIYFVDPLTYDTNVLPAQWAAPSINVANEGSIQFKTAQPVSVETYAGEHLDLPVMAARWAFEGAVAERTHKVYIPIPEGYELMLGGFWDGYGAYPAYQVHLENGNMSPVINNVEKMDPSGQNVVPRQGIVGRGIELFFEREAVAGGWLEIQALIGRLSKIRSTDPLEFYRDDLEEISRNLFTNPNMRKGTQVVEVARNFYSRNPGIRPDYTRNGTSYWNGATGTGVVSYPESAWSSSGSAFRYTWTNDDPQSANIGPAVSGLNLIQGADLVTIVWKTQVSHTATAPGGITSNPAEVTDTVLDTSPPVTQEPGVTYTHWVTVNSSDFPVGTQIRQQYYKPDAPDAWMEVSEFDCYPGMYDPNREWFDGDLLGSDTNSTKWAGTNGASQSVMEAWMPRGITVANGVGYLTSEGFEFTPKPDLPATITPATFLDSDTSYTIVMEARVDGSATINGEEFEDMGWTTLAFPIIQSSGTRATYPIPVITGSSAKITIRKMGILAGIGEVEVFSGDDDGYYEWDGAENNSESVKLKRHLKHEVYGPWVGGQGHSGCRFDGEPTYIEYTGVNGGQVGYAATFREVGSWEYV